MAEDFVFYSEYQFVERCIELDCFARFRNSKPQYQSIIGEIVFIDYGFSIDWFNDSKDSVKNKKTLQTQFRDLMKKVTNNKNKKKRASSGLSKVKCFLSDSKYSALFPSDSIPDDKYFSFFLISQGSFR